MKKRTQALLLVLCAVLLVAGSVLGTMAYLTDTEKVTNTFTVGNVHIKLDEAKVDEYGKPIEPAERVEGTTGGVAANTYKLLPNHTYTKDPTVTVLNTSEQAYVRILMTIDKKAALDAIGFTMTEVFQGYDANKWEFKDETANGDTMTYEFRYFEIVDARKGEKKLEPLFTALYMPSTLTNDQLATMTGMNIQIVAHAIQADGFEDADAAWSAFDGQKK